MKSLFEMDAFDDSTWDLLDYTNFNFDDATSSDFSWVNSHSSSVEIDFSCTNTVPAGPDCLENVDGPKKRGRKESYAKATSKACRERLRREKLNESFMDLSTALQPGRTAKTDKLAILNDAIKVLNQLRTESQEYKEENQKLQKDIEGLKAEKNELREEKQILKVEKERMELQLKAMTISSPGFASPHPGTAAYHAAANKMALYPSYGLYPTWHYLPPSALDTSRDHELRPPAA